VKGDADSAIEGADVVAVVKGRYVTESSQGAPIEPRAILAEWQGDHVTIWSSTQVPFAVRSGVAETLGLPQNQIRVIVPHLGGGFGAKCELGFEPQVAALARAAGRPVKVVFSRRQEFLLPDHRRERMIVKLTTGVRKDGIIVARQGQLIIDNGAYSMDEPFLGQMAAMFAVGPYRIANIDVSADVVYTNTQPSGSVRAPTGPTTCWALEQHHDVVAERLGLDPVEFRRRNLVHEGDEGPTGQIFERIGAIETLEHAAAAIDWDRPLEDGEAVGIATGWWPSFPGASGANVTINADGSGTIVTGAQECGTGAVMALPILAAEVLGMRPDEFRILYQDTDAGPYDGGASGSQTTFNNGRAVIAAANEIREQLLDLAADFLEANRADLELADGMARVKGSHTSSVSIADLASEAAGAGLLLGRGSGEPPPTPAVNAASCVGRLGGESFAAPTFFTHAARVKVDRDTGVVRVLEIAASHESGIVINPIGAAGQIHGGVAMGIGQALSEGVLLSDDGRQRNPYLLDYKLQTAADVPPMTVDFVDAPSPTGGPKGLKGIAEPPCVPTPGAIANAIARATGTRVLELPMTPERVFDAIASANGEA
jgi:CO/xanthine dehydrogenase Mo-binding subunit